MGIYSVRTDSFALCEFDADSIDDAIEYAFAGEGLGIRDEASLMRKFPKYVEDGGYCVVEEDGEEIIVLGKPF